MFLEILDFLTIKKELKTKGIVSSYCMCVATYVGHTDTSLHVARICLLRKNPKPIIKAN